MIKKLLSLLVTAGCHNDNLLETESCHDAKFVGTGGTWGCRNDNLRRL